MSDIKISHIDLVFENCEYITLSPDMFTGLQIDDITTSYWVNCFQYRNGEVSKFVNCQNFEIFINKKGLDSIYYGDRNKTIRDRLISFLDITHIHIHFNDETNEYITVPWEGDEDVNNLEEVNFNDDGNDEIYIKISYPRRR